MSSDPDRSTTEASDNTTLVRVLTSFEEQGFTSQLIPAASAAIRCAGALVVGYCPNASADDAAISVAPSASTLERRAHESVRTER